jgi:hypothetical protein
VEPAVGTVPVTDFDKVARSEIAEATVELHKAQQFDGESAGAEEAAEIEQAIYHECINSGSVLDRDELVHMPMAFGGDATNKGNCVDKTLNVLQKMTPGLRKLGAELKSLAEAKELLEKQKFEADQAAWDRWKAWAWEGVCEAVSKPWHAAKEFAKQKFKPMLEFMETLERTAKKHVATLKSVCKAIAQAGEEVAAAFQDLVERGYSALLVMGEDLLNALGPEGTAEFIKALYSVIKYTNASNIGDVVPKVFKELDPIIGKGLNEWANEALAEDPIKGGMVAMIVLQLGMFSHIVQDAVQGVAGMISASANAIQAPGTAASDLAKNIKKMIGELWADIVAAACGSEEAKQKLLKMLPLYEVGEMKDKYLAHLEANEFYQAGQEQGKIVMKLLETASSLTGAGVVLCTARKGLTMVVKSVARNHHGKRVVTPGEPTGLVHTKKDGDGFSRDVAEPPDASVRRANNQCDKDGHCFLAGTPVATAQGAARIESLRVGRRVLTTQTMPTTGGKAGTSPVAATATTMATPKSPAQPPHPTVTPTAVDPSTWKALRVEMHQNSFPDRPAIVHLLRSPEWMQHTQAHVGGQISLSLEEIGLHGWAKITDIQPCPTLAEGPGRVVLATMETTADRVLEIVLAPNSFRGPPEGREEIRGKKEETGSILRPTATHPIFSETAGKWVSAGELRKGDMVRTAEGNAEIAEIRGYPGQHQVFNLEVEGEHEYFAGDGRVLSHNTCPGGPSRDEWVQGGNKQMIREANNNFEIAEYLHQKGHGSNIRPNPREGVDGAGRQGDALIDGVPHEFKTLQPTSTAKTIENVVNKSTKGEGQARAIVINARKTLMTAAEAREGALKALNSNRAKLDKLHVFGQDWEVIIDLTN